MTKVITINSKSTSLKFKLYNMPNEEVIFEGKVKEIGTNESTFNYSTTNEENVVESLDIPNHRKAVQVLFEKLLNLEVIQSIDEIKGVGHRVVHGGKQFSDSALITDSVVKKIEELAEFAPLHNPANVEGIRALHEVLPNVPAIAVFDTAFHQTMENSSYLYSLPYEYYEKYDIRKYGFHGISHKYATERAAQLLGKPLEHLRLISCHIGTGSSITAIKGGKVLDTTMGFTPLSGLTQNTKVGKIDPSVIPYLMEKLDCSVEDVIEIFNSQSGLLGLSGISQEHRELEVEAKKGNERAQLALDVFTDRIQKYIGSYAVLMNGVDAIIFTAGVGTNSPSFRKSVLSKFEFMGVHLNDELNNNCEKEKMISHPDSNIKVLVIPRNEDILIARDVVRIAKNVKNPKVIH